MIFCSKKLHKEAFLSTRFLQVFGWINNLSWPRRIPAEFPPRENTQSAFALEKPVHLLQPTQHEIYFPNSPPAPSRAKTKAGKQEFLIWLPQLGPGGPNSSELKYKGAYCMCILLVTRNTEQQNQSRVTCLESPLPGAGGSLQCKHRLPLTKSSLIHRETSPALTNANGNPPLG